MSYGELKGFKDHFGFGGVAPGLCSILKAIPEQDLGTVSLKWKDPIDTYIEGNLIASWKRTTIIRKKGSYPTSITDGEKIAEITTRDQYATAELVDRNFPEGATLTDYFYMAFPESDTGAISVNERNRFIPGARYVHYAIEIDLNNSDPAGRITYLEECADFESAYMDYTAGVFKYGSWKNAFFMPKPCMLKSDGTVAYYLNPDDYSLREDGSASDYNNTSFDGNVMIEFPTVWIWIDTSGAKPVIHFSDQQIDENYRALAHHDQSGNVIPYIYVGAYDGALVSSKVRCISGLTPMNTQTGANEITYAKNNGSLWYTGVLADRLLINMLLMLIGKSTNTQSVFGNGHYTGGSQASSLIKTGTMDKRGLFWGTNGSGNGVKVFGIENYWGNLWKRIAGLINANGTQKYKLTYGTEDGSTVIGYNTDGSGYKTLAGGTPGGTSGGYISKVLVTEDGYFPITASGSETTFECDGLWFNNSQSNYAFVGGSCNDGFLCGAFTVALSNAVSDSSWIFGASLSCKPTA